VYPLPREEVQCPASTSATWNATYKVVSIGNKDTRLLTLKGCAQSVLIGSN